MIQEPDEYDIQIIQGLQSVVPQYFAALSLGCSEKIKEKQTQIMYILQECESLAKGQAEIMHTLSEVERT